MPPVSSASLPTAGPALRQVLVRRVVVAIAAILIGLVPIVVFGLINGQWSASSWAIWGMLTALINLILGGRLLALASTGLLVALTPVAIVSGSAPVAGAGVMAIMCFGVGLSAARGHQPRDDADPAVYGLHDHRPARLEWARRGLQHHLVSAVDDADLRRGALCGRW